MDTKSSSSPALVRARLDHLFTAALSLSEPATSTAAFLGDEALNLQRPASYRPTEPTQTPTDALAQALALVSQHRRLVGHIEFCNRCGLCLLPGTTARRVVKRSRSRYCKDESSNSTRTQTHVPRPSKRRKAEWGPRKAVNESTATESRTLKPTEVSARLGKTEPHVDPRTSARTAKAPKPSTSSANAQSSPSAKRVKSIELNCIKCGGCTRLGPTPFAAAVAAALLPSSSVHASHKSVSAPTTKTQTASPASKNEKSKRRAKARKQGALAAEVERDKEDTNESRGGGGGLGFDLMDFMKG